MDDVQIPSTLVCYSILPIKHAEAISKAAEAMLRGDEWAAENFRRRAGYDGLSRLCPTSRPRNA